MPPNKQLDNLEKLKTVFTVIQDSITKKEFVDSFQALTNLILKIEKQLISKIDDKVVLAGDTLQEEFKQLAEKMKDQKFESLDDIKKEAHDLMMRMMKDHDSRMKGMEKHIMSIRDGKDGANGKDGASGQDGKDGKDGENADPAIIEELKEELKNKIKILEERISSIPRGKLGMRKVPIIKRYNLSSQCDGATKAFTLPRDTVDVLGVFGTQFPINFNPGTDWTFAGTTLTLADGITAPATGETLYAIIESLFYG